MEETPSEGNDLPLGPDLNCDYETDGSNPLSFAAEAEFSSLTIEEMEARLEFNQPVQDEFVAYGLYCIYARAKGFNIRKDRVQRFSDGTTRARDFVCSSEGGKDEKRSKLTIPAFVKPTQRCNCKAKLRVARLKGQHWRVTSFRKEHNHDMYTPDQTYLLRSARHISPEMQKCIETMVACRIPAIKAYEFLETMLQGRENVGFTKKDMYDSMSRTKKHLLIEHSDIDQLMEHFMEMSNKEPNFFWNIERDENKRLVNVFFRDNRCSIDYDYFGDVLSVDTTYQTNKYGLVLCPFVGINHHLQNVMFGCAFMSNETESSFEWLFRTFLESMGGKQPETIFTDQCQAMMNAIETVFLDSHHRLCHWHINQNAPHHFGSLNGYKEFKILWHKCMKDCESEEEFEETWKQMVDHYNIEDKDWFTNMYKLRHKWATAFSRHKFSAGLMATSRSEGTNAALKRKIGGRTASFYDCVIGYKKVQDSWRVDENAKDAISHHGRLLVRLDPWLTQAAVVYTLEIFTLFQQEHNQLSNYSITGQQEVFGTSSISFTMISRRWKSEFATVLFDPHTTFVSCTCHKFETCGILCSHSIKVLERVDVDFIPERYIKKRWTKYVQYKVCDVPGVSSSHTGVLPVVYAQEMVKKTYDLATRAQSLKEARDILVECLENANEKLNNWFRNMNIDDLATNDVLGVNEGSRQTDDKLVLDPLKRITYAHKRHWEVGGKRGRGRGQCSRTMRGRKRGGRGSQTIGDRCPSQEGYAQTFQGAMNVQLPFHPPSISSQSNVNQHVLFMPFHGSCNASQSSATLPIQYMEQFSSSILASQPLQLRDQVAPFALQLLANQHPWPSMSSTNTWVNCKDM